jgi:hypothetical protein
MAWQSKGNRYDRYQRRETSGTRFLRYALIGILLGMVLVFVEEFLLFDEVYAYYEISKILSWLSHGHDVGMWRSFWPYLTDYGKVSPQEIVDFIENRSGFQLWFCLRLLLCHIASLCGVFWFGYRWSTRAMVNRPLEMGNRGTRIISSREADTLFRRNTPTRGDDHD